MSYVITDPCVDVKDGACVDVCPVDCIQGKEDATDRMCYINADECIDCAACEPVCPVNAIFSEDDVPAASKGYIAVNSGYAGDAAGARAQVDQLKPR